MKHRTLLVLVSLLISLPAHAQRAPSPVPPGWTQEQADPETRTRRFASPNGRAWLQTRQTFADRSALDQDMDDVAYRDGEQITYQKRGRTWIAVSGYWGDQIFYRKSNLACGGTVWHHIEFGYPRAGQEENGCSRRSHGARHDKLFQRLPFKQTLGLRRKLGSGCNPSWGHQDDVAELLPRGRPRSELPLIYHC